MRGIFFINMLFLFHVFRLCLLLLFCCFVVVCVLFCYCMLLLYFVFCAVFLGGVYTIYDIGIHRYTLYYICL